MFGQTFKLPPTLSRQERSNFIYFFWDISWWNLFVGSTNTFLTIYASRVGATSSQIGLLTAIPALFAIVVSLPFGRWIRRFPAQRVAYTSAFATRILYLGFALLPWLLPTKLQFSAILAISIAIAIPSTVLNISFSQFFIESVPLKWRGLVVGARMAIGSIVCLVTTLLCGQILTRVAFPLNYQIVFFMGFVGAIMTVYQMYHIHPVKDPDAPIPTVEEKASAEQHKLLPTITAQSRYYLRVIALLFMITLTVNMVNPLIPNLLVNRLKLPDELISIGASITTVVVLAVSLFMARLTRKTGNRRATTLGAVILSLQALSLALAHNAGFYLVSTVMVGMANGILNVAQTNYYYENIPATEQSTWISINVMIGNLATLMGALCGPLIATFVGAPIALMIFAGLEIAIGLIIFKWG